MGMEALERDSQRNSVLSQQNLSHFPLPKLSVDQSDVNNICNMQYVQLARYFTALCSRRNNHIRITKKLSMLLVLVGNFTHYYHPAIPKNIFTYFKSIHSILFYSIQLTQSCTVTYATFDGMLKRLLKLVSLVTTNNK